MEKRILTSEECGLLIPHWYQLDPNKLSRINGLATRISKPGFGPKIEVMNVPAILTYDDGYILNGKHRSFLAALRRSRLEQYVVSHVNEIEHNVKKESWGDLFPDELIKSLEHRKKYIHACNSRGIYCINDLVRLYTGGLSSKLNFTN
jgi:hypothetical protein